MQVAPFKTTSKVFEHTLLGVMNYAGLFLVSDSKRKDLDLGVIIDWKA